MKNKNKEKISLNLLNDKCPITFVKTKLALESLDPNQYLEIRIRKGEALDGMPSSLKELGFKIEKQTLIKENVFSIKVIPS